MEQKTLHEWFKQFVNEYGESIISQSRFIDLLCETGGEEFSKHKFIIKCSVDEHIGEALLGAKKLKPAIRILTINQIRQSFMRILVFKKIRVIIL